MALAKTKRFGEIAVEIQTGTSPEVWTKPCGVRTKGFNRTASMTETEVPDCDNEDLPADIVRDILSRSAEIPLAGALDSEDLDVWDDWWDDGDTRNVRITVPGNAASGGRTYVGGFKLGTFNLGAERGARWTFEATLQSDGRVVRTNAAS